MPNPRCPKCPYNQDDSIVASNAKPGKWFCQKCGSYYDKIGDVSAPHTVKRLIKLETDPDLLWTAEEIAAASDRPMAQFYAGINSEDRADLKRNHVEVNGDFRNEVSNDPPDSNNQPDGFTTHRDTV